MKGLKSYACLNIRIICLFCQDRNLLYEESAAELVSGKQLLCLLLNLSIQLDQGNLEFLNIIIKNFISPTPHKRLCDYMSIYSFYQVFCLLLNLPIQLDQGNLEFLNIIIKNFSSPISP